MATIGKLAVQITADTAGLSSGLANAGRQTDDFQNRLGGLTNKLKILGPAAIAAGGAFAIGMVKSVANTADELAKLSARTGVAVEDLSRLQYAAGLSGVSNQTLTASIERLSRGMAEAANGTGEAGKAFEAMGVSVKNQDGSLRSQRDVLQDVAERFSGYADGAEKSALAQQIFGRSGAQLIPLLNNGAKGLKDMADESDRLGNTISRDTARAAERFNDNIMRMTTLAGGLARELSGPVIQSLADVTDRMIEATRAGRGFLGVLSSIFESSVGNRKILDQAAQDIERINQAIRVMLITSNGRLSPAQQIDLQNLSAELEKAIANYDALKAAQEAATGPDGDGRLSAPVVGGETQADKDRAKELEKIKEHEHAKVQAFIEGLQMREDARIAANMSESELERERYVLEQEQLLESLNQKMITLAEYQQLELEGLMNHREAMAHIEMDYLDRIAEAERRSADERMALQKRVADFNVSVQQDQNNRIVALLSTLGARNKGFALAAIALQTATAFKQNKIATALAANLAFASQIIPGDPSSLARAKAARAFAFSQGAVTGGLILAAGAVQAAGALGGGTTAGAAASAGVSSGGLSAPSSSGSVGSVGSVMANGVNRGQQVTIQLQGETFGRDAVRNLISEINEAISDGAVLRLA
jgi:hypothetical protein